jgi:hypothetical protein
VRVARLASSQRPVALMTPVCRRGRRRTGADDARAPSGISRLTHAASLPPLAIDTNPRPRAARAGGQSSTLLVKNSLMAPPDGTGGGGKVKAYGATFTSPACREREKRALPKKRSRRSNPTICRDARDCSAELVIGPAKRRTRWLAMTAGAAEVPAPWFGTRGFAALLTIRAGEAAARAPIIKDSQILRCGGIRMDRGRRGAPHG